MTDWLIQDAPQNRSKKSVKEIGQRIGQKAELVLEHIKRNPYITRDELSEEMHMAPSSIQRYIDILKKDRIRRIDGKQKGYWEIIEN